jgi:hypothetical protein
MGVVASICHPSHVRSVSRRITVQAIPGITQNPIRKITKAKRAGVQVVVYLPSKYQVLSSNSSTIK